MMKRLNWSPLSVQALMKNSARRLFFTVALAALLMPFAPLLPQVHAVDIVQACPATLQHTFARLQDEKPQSLC